MHRPGVSDLRAQHLAAQGGERVLGRTGAPGTHVGLDEIGRPRHEAVLGETAPFGDPRRPLEMADRLRHPLQAQLQEPEGGTGEVAAAVQILLVGEREGGLAGLPALGLDAARRSQAGAARQHQTPHQVLAGLLRDLLSFPVAASAVAQSPRR